MTVPDRARLENLIGTIEEDLDAAESNFDKIKTVLSEADPEEDVIIMGIAGFINRWYGAIENIFYRILMEMNGSKPEGERWHMELIKLMTLDIEDLRPPVISKDTRKKIDEFRRFRHLVRYDYGGVLDEGEVLQKARKLENLHPEVSKEIEQFLEFLEKLASRREK